MITNSLSLSLSLSLVSCEDEITNDTITAKSGEGGGDMECELEPHGLYFDNGVSPSTGNNMMHFPSWDSFEYTIGHLDNLVELHEDSFVIPNDLLSEDALNDLEESSGFEEDQPLIDYENSHNFFSLRAFARIKEDNWLDNSDQSGWTWDDDPDNDWLIHGTEQTVYNQYYEVMICSFIFKYMEGGVIVIDSQNQDASSILNSANNGVPIEELLTQFAGSNEKPGGITDHVIYDNSGECVFKVADTKRFILSNPRYRVKGIQHMSGYSVGGNGLKAYFKYKSITKNYKKKGSKWKKRRIKSYAKIVGERHDPYLGCGSPLIEVDKRSTIKKRRRRKVVIRVNPESYNSPSQLGTEIQKLESVHWQRGETFRYYYEN